METRRKALPLYQYQIEAADWLYSRKYGLLELEMGLGKTAASITAMEKYGAKKILIICPSMLVNNWADEFFKWSNYEHVLTAKSSREIEAANVEKLTGILICSYNLAVANASLLKTKFDVVLCDESHYLKSSEAKRTQAILGSDGLCHSADKFWLLSGTPMTKDVTDLWPMLFVFGATSLTLSSFMDRYTNYRLNDYKKKVVTGIKRENSEELKRILNSVSFRRSKEEVGIYLPKIMYANIDFDGVDLETISDSDMLLIKTQEKELAGIVGNSGEFPFENFEQLKEISLSISALRKYHGKRKVTEAAHLVNDELELSLYDKVLIFCVHRDVVAALTLKLSDHGAVSIYGDMSQKDKDRSIDFFLNKKDCKVMVANITTAGVGLNFTHCSQIIFVESSWSYAENLQAVMRCHRLGQTRPVQVRFAMIRNSIDQRVERAVMRKMEETNLLTSKEYLGNEDV